MRKVKSELAQPSKGNSQRSRRNIGFNTISTHSLIRETKQMQASIKKERLDNRSLKYILVCSIAE